MRCKQCAYDLRDLGEHRCPECGRTFDPQRPKTWLSSPVSGRKNLLLAIVGAVLFIIPLAIAFAADLGIDFMSRWPIAVRVPVGLLGAVMMITGMTIQATVFRTGTLVLLNRHPWVTDRKTFYASVPISMAVLGYFLWTLLRNVFNVLT